MNETAILMDRLATQEGFNETLIAGVRIFKATHSRPREPLCYEQGVIIVGQGSKRVFFGGKIYEYNSDNYLVLSVPIPAECETFATDKEPLLALTVDIDVRMLNRIINKMDDHLGHALFPQKEKHKGIFLSDATLSIKDTVLRLLKAQYQ